MIPPLGPRTTGKKPNAELMGKPVLVSIKITLCIADGGVIHFFYFQDLVLFSDGDAGVCRTQDSCWGDELHHEWHQI